MAESAEHKEELHRKAMAFYKLWQADRAARRSDYDAAVNDYHARLDDAAALSRARDRAEYARNCPQHDAHVRAWRSSLVQRAAE